MGHAYSVRPLCPLPWFVSRTLSGLQPQQGRLSSLIFFACGDVVWLGFSLKWCGGWDWELPAGFLACSAGVMLLVSAALPFTPRWVTTLGRHSAFQSALFRLIVSGVYVAASLSLSDCVVHTVHYIVWVAILAFRFSLIPGLLLAPQFGLLLLSHFLGDLSRHSLFNMAFTSRSGFSSGIDFSQYDIGFINEVCLARFGRGCPTGIDFSGTCPILSRLERSDSAKAKFDQVSGPPALLLFSSEIATSPGCLTSCAKQMRRPPGCGYFGAPRLRRAGRMIRPGPISRWVGLCTSSRLRSCSLV
jgi:hypothetical protein